MPEDAGKKRYIKDFLQHVGTGSGCIEDIWIDRHIKPPGAEGQGSVARSLSGRSADTVKRLFEDDLEHAFEEGYFTFRFIAAALGSGKTALLEYFRQLVAKKDIYRNFSSVIYFRLSKLIGGNDDFHTKLYRRFLDDAFFDLLQHPNTNIKEKAEEILEEVFENSNQVSELKDLARKGKNKFHIKFNNYSGNIHYELEDLFLYLVSEITVSEPRFRFIYLLDELDALENYPEYLRRTRSLVKSLVKAAYEDFDKKLKLTIFLAGTQNNVNSFISEDEVLESLVGQTVINLSKGYESEIKQIREKVDDRIKGAYKGYKSFDQAWEEIQEIPVDTSVNLRGFCKYYANKVLEIHEKYFREEAEKGFEGDARQLVEAECKRAWSKYLSQSSYKLANSSTTNVVAGHAFDCYIQLLHNNVPAAIAYGEAKNYELLSEHLKVFSSWLKDVGYEPNRSEGVPSDLAFIIAPKCPILLESKINLKGIKFIASSKRQDQLPSNISVDTEDKDATIAENASEDKECIDINMASEESLVKALRGTRIGRVIVKEIITHRPYQDLEELEYRVSGISSGRRSKLQGKLVANEICFRIGAFISYNSQDVKEVKKIAKKIEHEKISIWMDDELSGGVDIRQTIESKIESDSVWAAVVFIGKHGIGQWQDVEISSLIRKFVKKGHPVIPVILKSCENEPTMPSFLENLNYVDFRSNTPDPLMKLIRSIRSSPGS